MPKDERSLMEKQLIAYFLIAQGFTLLRDAQGYLDLGEWVAMDSASYELSKRMSILTSQAP